MTVAEKVTVASEGPTVVSIEPSQMVASSKEGTRDGEPTDTVRIERLKGSIVKIRDQIERTRKELDGVCEVLRGAGDGNDDAAGLRPDGIGVGIGYGSATTSDLSANTPHNTPTTTLTNEQILEQARVTVNGHIKMLTRYNQLKDVAMVLFELLAEYQGKRVGEVLRERGVEADD